MKSIALISNSARSLVNFRGTLISVLVQAGLRVHALAPDFDDVTRAQIVALGAVPVQLCMDRTGTGLVRELMSFLSLARVLRRLRPDVTLAYFLKPVIYGSLAARLAGVPQRYALIEGLGFLFGSDVALSRSRFRLIRQAIERLLKLAFSWSKLVFLLNEEDRSLLIRRRLLSASKAVNIGGIGVDLDAFSKAPISPGPPVFLLAARLLEEKGIGIYAEACRRIRSTHPDVRCILVGGADPNPTGVRLRDVERWVANGWLEWPGEVPDVRPWLRQASVFVLPSFYREGVPRSIQEAMAMGRAIVTTDNVGCRDTVEDGANGYLVPVRDADALTAAMLRFVDMPERAVRMGAISRLIAQERFDAARVNRVILQHLQV